MVWEEIKFILIIVAFMALMIFIPVVRAHYASQACATLCAGKENVENVSLGFPWVCECRRR